MERWYQQRLGIRRLRFYKTYFQNTLPARREGVSCLAFEAFLSCYNAVPVKLVQS
jgi:hypothetical protein